ncbi:polysaccharide deacetylase family protein [Pontibacter sp. G13]|uniref:polysaccharide deacetylase family protein n=1 Tax=Pontibacter sp. G13 TaxID=3074898 RepID=UPI00288B04D3|nr:polysaccharide deacetylase family protein [Pontibacter sp. G13]WNJ16291.1 polysaccharide deacetylase family protein [Pontibacter sp. G13]
MFSQVYQDYTWRHHTDELVLYLTFDDGPIPDISDWVTEQLALFNAKGTFFWIGENVRKHAKLAHQILDEGHLVGNHTETHKNGWKTETKTYLKDFLQGQQTIAEYTGFQTKLFRPPYAKVRKSQARQILKSHEIVMMDIVAGDFDTTLEGAYCAEQVIKHAKPGSIVVFHDSVKAWDRLKVALPIVLKHFSEKGYKFRKLPEPEFYY